VAEQDGPDARQRLVSNTIVLTGALLTVSVAGLIVLFYALLPVMASSFSQAKRAETRTLFLLMVPIIPIMSIGMISGALLNAQERFKTTAFVPIITPLCTIAALMLFWRHASIRMVAGSVSVGAAIETAILVWRLRRIGIRLTPHWYGMDEGTRRVLRLFGPVIAGAFLMNGNPLIDQSFAASLRPGSVAALNYGYRIVAVVSGIAQVTLGTAVLPYFSGLAAANRWRELKHVFTVCTLWVAAGAIVVCAVMLAASLPIVHVLYLRGKFTSADALVVSHIQQCYCFQIPVYVCGQVVVRLIYCLQESSILLRVSALNLIVNVVTDYLFVRWLGVAGIALSTSVVYMCAFVFLLSAAGAKLNRNIRESDVP
jgi:putative peptidoglycan lipid II flippase